MSESDQNSSLSQGLVSMFLWICGLGMAALAVGLGLFVSPWFWLLLIGVIGVPLLLHVVVVRITVPPPGTQQ